MWVLVGRQSDLFYFFLPVCFHTRSSDSFIQCCLSVWSSVVSHVFTSELQYVVISIQMCLYNKRFLSTGISLAHLKSWRRPAAAVLLSANLIPALYTGLIHQRGTLDVMNHLQPLCDVGNVSTTRPQPDVFFLMPCHSTPFYRYLMCFNRFPNHCIQLFSFHTASQVFKIWDCLNLIFKIYSLKISFQNKTLETCFNNVSAVVRKIDSYKRA